MRQVIAIAAGLAMLSAAAHAADTKRPAEVDKGQALYESHCAACHGAYGRGDGPATADLVVDIPDLGGRFTKSDVADALSIVRDGRGAMPGYEQSLDVYDARRALRHLAKVASAPVPEPESAEGDPAAEAERDAETDSAPSEPASREGAEAPGATPPKAPAVEPRP